MIIFWYFLEHGCISSELTNDMYIYLVPRYYLFFYLFFIGRDKDLTEAEKQDIIKEISRGTPSEAMISIGRNVDTVKRYLANLSSRKTQVDAGVLKTVTDRDFRNIKIQLV